MAEECLWLNGNAMRSTPTIRSQILGVPQSTLIRKQLRYPSQGWPHSTSAPGNAFPLRWSAQATRFERVEQAFKDRNAGRIGRRHPGYEPGVNPVASTMWVAAAVLAGVVVALLLHATVIVLPLLLVGALVVGIAQHKSWRRNRRG